MKTIVINNVDEKTKDIIINLTAHKQTGYKDLWLIIARFNSNEPLVVGSSKENNIFETIVKVLGL